ncbi:MAG: hypothetical protein DI551_00325 [Micavibrio aeruginosavorus]|uniref:Type IV secretion protein DotH n=1 Tax=Micavibrio aeruginosavorus TaxID=349221 RepID=A0A2W5N6M5_9BACT|nr:MAG: hypothetical protein DI551_00325 [Micavibrio aeruginosavorus]
MTRRKISISFSRRSKAALAATLVCGVALIALSLPVVAQEAEQQLPDALVDQQIPNAFPQSGEATTQQNTDSAPAAKAPAKATPSSKAVSEMESSEQTQTAPAVDNAPAQPEQAKLVPSRAMGAAAQKVQSGGAAAPSADPSAEGVDLSHDVAPALPDMLDRYATPQTEGGAPEQQNGEALPEVSDRTMVELQASGFENAGAQRVKVPVDGFGGGKTPEEMQEEIRSEAFDAAITGLFPLSPDQIQGLLKRYDGTQKAASEPTYATPKPEISVQNVSLDPGVAPPTIKTAVGNVTTLNMLDATGAPWPVQDVTWAGDFEIVEPEEGGHIVRITPMSHFARGNIVIRLLTLKTPLTLTLETSRDVVQYRVDARIPEYGPFANAPLMQGAKSTLVAGSPDLTSLLDGVMPGGMTKLSVNGVDGRTTAYEMNGTTYVRTPLTLLSPAWMSSVSSADGMNVYALNNAPVLLLSDGGEFMRATLKEKEDLLDE